MAVLTGQALGPNGVGAITDVVGSLAAANGGGDSFFMTGRDVFVCVNGSGGSITITFVAVTDNFGVLNAVHNETLVLPAGKMGMWGPPTFARYKDANGFIQITYSGVTLLTVGVLRIGVGA